MMKTLTTMQLPILLVTSLCLAADPHPSTQPGALDSAYIAQLQKSFSPDAHEQRLMDAVQKNELRQIAVNSSVLRDHNPYFSHEIKTGKITDQKGSGRCWMYAGLNILRPAVIEKIEDESFEFSQNYLFFWDKIEKSNTFLEEVIKRRKMDVRDENFQRILTDPVGDGGWWEYFSNLVRKYGVVPMSAMPETKHTENSGVMDNVLTQKLREDAAELRDMDKKGASVEKLRARKEELLKEIYHILTFHLGVPPTQFTFRYKSKVDEERKMDELVKIMDNISRNDSKDFAQTQALKDLAKDKVSLVKTYTPLQFAEEYVKAKMEEYVVLGNVPARDLNKRFVMENSRNMWGEKDSEFLNVSIVDLKKAALQSVLNDEGVWFGADIGPQRDNKTGILNSELYKYDDIYGTKSRFTKAEHLLYRNVETNHAMAFVGVDVVDDTPLKWKVENSWGTDVGDGGYWAMYDNWFDEYVIMVIVNKKYLPDRILGLVDSKPEIIKENDVMGKLLMIK
jgi:bleomycin hydrolase